jgi:hypothetical protein
MHIYRGTLELLDYVFYATVERGKVYETGPFIHNYALAYALGLARSKTYTYTHLIQEPHYVEELTPLNGRLYLTPAAPQRVAYRLVQWNTLRESYVLTQKEQSVGYPDWGFARMLRPGSRFTFYLMVQNPAALPDAPALRDLLAGQPTRAFAWASSPPRPASNRNRLTGWWSERAPSSWTLTSIGATWRPTP